LDAEKRIPDEVFEGFKRTVSSGGYVVVAIGQGKENASEVFLDNGYPLGRDGYAHALAVANETFYLQEKEYVPDEEWNVKLEKVVVRIAAHCKEDY